MSKFDQERNAITVEGKPPMQLSIQLVRDIFGVPEEVWSILVSSGQLDEDRQAT